MVVHVLSHSLDLVTCRLNIGLYLTLLVAALAPLARCDSDLSESGKIIDCADCDTKTPHHDTLNYHARFQDDDRQAADLLVESATGAMNESPEPYSSGHNMPAREPPNRLRAMQRYRGFSMLRTYPQTQRQIEELRKFLEDPVPGIDFWNEPTGLNRSVDIMVSPEARDSFRYTLKMMNLSGRIMIPDIGKAMLNGRSNQVHVMRSVGTQEPDSFYKTYRTYTEIESHLFQLQSEFPDTMKILSIGRSFENRKLYLIKLSAPDTLARYSDPTPDMSNNTIDTGTQYSEPQQKGKSIIWIDAGHHAREWISHASGMFILETLLRDFKQRDEQIMKLFDTYDFYFVPVVNPDGYQYSHDYDRLWRKTRSKHTSGWLACVGVDPNRNYPTNWMKSGASQNPCSEIYAGPRALSEPETKALAQTVLKYKNRIKVYLSLHAYSQLLLCPWGHAREYPPHYDEMKSLAEVMLKGVQLLYGTPYIFGTSSMVLYPAAGGSDDFALAEGGIKYSYTMELRDTGAYGFNLPDRLIKPTAEETYLGVVAMAKELMRRGEY